MVAVQELEQTLLTRLGYSDTQGLVASADSVEQRPIPYLSHLYTVNDVPVAYFTRPPADEEVIREIYQSAWNKSTAPLLYVFLPDEIRIYNAYSGPAKQTDQLQSLILPVRQRVYPDVSLSL